MKYQKLVKELNNLLDSATRERQKQQGKVQAYLEQFKAEEKELQKKMQNENDKIGREKLQRQLSTVRQAYAILGC